MMFSPVNYGINMHKVLVLTAGRVEVTSELAFQLRDQTDGSEEVDTSPCLQL